MTEARTVYVGDRATLEQVAAAVKAWQEQATGDTTVYEIEADGDGFAGMGIAVDIYAPNDAEQDAAVDRLAAGIRPILAGVPVRTDRELDTFV